MGCSASIDIAHEAAHNIALEDFKLIKESWKNVNDKKSLGIQLMMKLFKSDSDIKTLWIFANNLTTDEEMLQSSDMIYHAQKIIRTLDATIDFISVDPETADEENKETFERLINLGIKHFEYGLKNEYFKVFEEIFMECLQNEVDPNQLNENLIYTWRMFIQFIMVQFETGMHEAINLQHQNNKVHNS